MSNNLNTKDIQKVFHEHLDVCQQCERNPFNLCRIGARILDGGGDSRPVVVKNGEPI